MFSTWIAWPLGAFSTAALAHGLAMRLPLGLNSVSGFLAIGIPTGLVLVALQGPPPWASILSFASVCTYAFLCELYIFFFTLVISSISASTLIELRRSPMEERRLVRISDPSEMVQTRISRLVDTGLVSRDGDHLLASARGKQLDRQVERLRRLFGHDSAPAS